MQKTPISDGFAAGLKFWLFFLLCFALIGYPAELSIFFGAVAGLTGGFIVTWWQTKDDQRPVNETTAKVEPETLTKSYKLRAKSYRKFGEKKRWNLGYIWSSWFSRNRNRL